MSSAPTTTTAGRAAGSFGVGCFSFYATKNITTGRFPKIVACTLHNDAGVIGAAALENSI